MQVKPELREDSRRRSRFGEKCYVSHRWVDLHQSWIQCKWYEGYILMSSFISRAWYSCDEWNLCGHLCGSFLENLIVLIKGSFVTGYASFPVFLPWTPHAAWSYNIFVNLKKKGQEDANLLVGDFWTAEEETRNPPPDVKHKMLYSHSFKRRHKQVSSLLMWSFPFYSWTCISNCIFPMKYDLFFSFLCF